MPATLRPSRRWFKWDENLNATQTEANLRGALPAFTDCVGAAMAKAPGARLVLCGFSQVGVCSPPRVLARDSRQLQLSRPAHQTHTAQFLLCRFSSRLPNTASALDSAPPQRVLARTSRTPYLASPRP